MDYKKDIYHKDNTNKGQIKDIGNDYKTVSNDSGGFFDFIIKKAQKVTSALYLVTDLIPSADPIKLKLREKSLLVISDISYYYGGAQLDKNDVLLKLSNSISEIISLFEIAAMSGLVSEMNASILKKEYLSLKEMIEAKKSEHLKDIIFNKNFFSESESVLGDRDGGPKHTTLHSGAVFKPNLVKENEVDVVEKKPVYREKSVRLGAGMGGAGDVVKKSRRSMILDLIKEKQGELSVRDIALHIKGYSEKTLQRDLVSMVSDGLLSKKGERRWSRYSMVK